ncbi:MAG: cell division protein SepF [Acidobacteria bacterium]|nr:cell division protein SepF [Acidobacteriota bacterium]
MASLWNKALFQLGLVDDEQVESSEEQSGGAGNESGVRRVEASQHQAVRPVAPVEPPSVSHGIIGRRVEPPSMGGSRPSGPRTRSEAGVTVRASGGGPLTADETSPQMHIESELVVARSFDDAKALADHIRANRPVVMDLRGTEPEMVRRLVDFASGLTYSLSGNMAKIAQGVILVTPPNRSISVQERQRLADLGLYSGSVG